MSHILLTFDVEDWFQVENLRPYCPPATWDQYELRVERNTHRLLDLMDSIQLRSSNWSSEAKNCAPPVPSHSSASAPTTYNLQPTTDNRQYNLQPTTYNTTYNLQPTTKITATFFILGWVAERLPGLVREIGNRGHEIASHGYGHELCSGLGREELREDISRSKKLLEDIAGARVHGYRAPGFSAGNSVLDLVREAGYAYDSSFNSIEFNHRCARVDLSGALRRGNAWRMPSGLVELPISNLRIGARSIPWGGGGYFRLYPLPLYLAGVRRILRREGGFVFYMHPWEVDPGQPKIDKLGAVARFRHYHNLNNTAGKLRRFLDAMRESPMTSCVDYLRGLPAAGQEWVPFLGSSGCAVEKTSPETSA